MSETIKIFKKRGNEKPTPLFIAVLALFLSGCPQRQEIDSLILKDIANLKSKALLYAFICYPKGELEKGASKKELQTYSDQLISEIDQMNTSWSSQEELQSIQSQIQSFKNKYSKETILFCARRNFSYTSETDKKWFEVFDRYGQEVDSFERGIEPFKKIIFERDTIIIGNTHSEIKHGNILFELTDYFKKNNRAVEGLITESLIGSPFNESLSKIRDLLLKGDRSFMGGLIPDAYAQSTALDYLAQVSRGETEAAQKKLIFLELPRWITDIKYRVIYPTVNMIGIDRRKEDKSDLNLLASIDILLLRTHLQKSLPGNAWLIFYGTSHILRFPGTVTSQIESELDIRAFVIDQALESFNTEIKKAKELGLINSAKGLALILKFAFPYSENQKDSENKSFAWLRRIERYQTLQRHHVKPIFVNLFDAKEKRALSFNENINPADLVIMAPSDKEWGMPFKYENDGAYQFLGDLLN